MSIKRTVLSTHPLIRNTLLIVPLLLVVVVYFLRQGITIDSLKIGRFQVEGLYLKLDKKLTAKLQYVRIPQSKKSTTNEIENELSRIKYLPRYFQSISIDRAEVADDTYRILYRDNVIYLSNNAYEIATIIRHNNGVVEGELPLVYLKKYGFQFSGKFLYDYRKDIAMAEGNYTVAGLDGALKIKQVAGNIHFALSSQPVTTMLPFLRTFDLSESLNLWVGKRIDAKKYEIRSLEGDVHKKNGKWVLDENHLYGEFALQDARVRFEPKLDVVRARSAQATLKDNVLYVQMTAPTYRKRSLKGSRLHVTNIFGTRPSLVHLEIQAVTACDKTVLEILKAFKVNLPLLQRSGSARASVVVDAMTDDTPTRYHGEVNITAPGSVDLYGTTFKVHRGRVTFDEKQVKLKRVDVDTQWLRARLGGTLDLAREKAALRLDVRRLRLGGTKHPFLLMKDASNVAAHLEWRTGWKIALPRYKSVIVGKGKKGFNVLVSDIQPLLPYLKGLPVAASGGSARVTTRDGKRFDFSGKLTWPGSYLYDKQKAIKHFAFSGHYDGRHTTLSSLKGRIRYDGARSLVRLSNLYIDGKKALDRGKQGTQTSGKVHVKGTGGLIRYEKYVLLTDQFDLRMNGKSTQFYATKDGDRVHVELNGNAIVARAQRIKARMLRALVHFGGLKGGRYSLDLRGNIKGTMRGTITIEGGEVSSFETYDNMVELANTVPTLSGLSDAKAGKKGFVVRSGRIEFHVVKNRIYFDMIYIDGKTAEISGKGTVSTQNGAINMDLAVRTARGIGKIIGSIPIVGYILMGKDKSITTGVKVTGTLENPKVTTHMVMEALLAPFKMVVRTLQSPAHIINK